MYGNPMLQCWWYHVPPLLDLASKSLLPDPSNTAGPQPDRFQRRNLGPRLAWLFDNGLLPADLRTLASSVKDDGNDSAHAGTICRTPGPRS